MKPRGTQIRHQTWVPGAMPFFIFGFAYYLVSPALVSQFLSDDNDVLSVASSYLNSGFFNVDYFFDTLAIFGSFSLGYLLGKLASRAKTSILDYGAYQSAFPTLLAISFGVLIIYFSVVAATSGIGFFTGYSSYNIAVLGPFSTCVFLAAWFANYFSRKQVVIMFLAFFVFCSVLLLGWGSRMFFALGLVTLLLGVVSKNRHLLQSVRLYAVIAAFALLLVVVGVLRQGGELSADKLLGILFAEPLFTSVSGSLYLENAGGRPTFGVPHDLYVSVIHFIPSAVFPGKVELMGQIAFNENVESPFGAKSLIVNLYANFGLFYPVFLACIGGYFGFLYTKSRTSNFYRAVYFSALPVLLLLFFREGLATVVKVLLFNGLLVPLLVSLFLVWLSPRPIADIKRRIGQIGVGVPPTR